MRWPGLCASDRLRLDRACQCFFVCWDVRVTQERRHKAWDVLARDMRELMRQQSQALWRVICTAGSKQHVHPDCSRIRVMRCNDVIGDRAAKYAHAGRVNTDQRLEEAACRFRHRHGRLAQLPGFGRAWGQRG